MKGLSPELVGQLSSATGLVQTLKEELSTTSAAAIKGVLEGDFTDRIDPLKSQLARDDKSKQKILRALGKAVRGIVQTKGMTEEQQGDLKEQLLISRQTYLNEVIKPLAQLERDWGLKPGLLVEPAMHSFDEALFAAVAEVELPIEDKLSILSDHRQMAALISEDPVSQNIEGLVTSLTTARQNLETGMPLSLSPVFMAFMTPKPTGIPYPEAEDKPPQVRAMQELVNNLYTAEVALQALEKVDLSGPEGKTIAAHHGGIALSALQQTFLTLNDADPEVRNLVHVNRDQLASLAEFVPQWVNQSGLVKKTGQLNQGKAIDLVAGLRLDADSPVHSDQGQMNPISTVEQILQSLQQVNELLSDPEQATDQVVLASTENLDKLSGALYRVADFADQDGLFAVIALARVSTYLLNEDSDSITSELITTEWQKFVRDDHSNLLIYLDKLEQQNYLQPGALTDPIHEQVKTMGRYVQTLDSADQTLPIVPEQHPAARMKAMMVRRRQLTIAEAILQQQGQDFTSPERQSLQLKTLLVTEAMNALGIEHKLVVPPQAPLRQEEIVADSAQPVSIQQKTAKPDYSALSCFSVEEYELAQNLAVDQKQSMNDYCHAHKEGWDNTRDALYEADKSRHLRGYLARAHSLNSPLREQYISELQRVADEQRPEELPKALRKFENRTLFYYKNVDKGIGLLDGFNKELGAEHQSEKDYLSS
jgi:hypothetical protein